MNCVELQESLAEVEDGSRVEQQAHLRSCPACTTLVQELDLIIAAAGQLQSADEPSPRVWNSIEIALRQEGLILPQRAARAILPSFVARWGAARWLVPAAAMLLLSLGIYLRRESQPRQLAHDGAVPGSVSKASDHEDADVIQEVALHVPTLKAQNAENLRRGNQS